MQKPLRFALRTLSLVAPRLAAAVAARLWFSIPKPRQDDAAIEFLCTGTRFTTEVKGAEVVAWRWGTGPAVLLMHGWGGYAGQLRAFAEPLTRAGFQVVAFDAPSHGASSPGMLGPGRATLFDFSDALEALVRDLPELAGIIAHSGGCAAAAWALRRRPELRVRRMVFIAPFGSAARYMALFQRALGFSDAVMRRFRESTERQFNFRWADFEVAAMADGVRMPPLLVIHDQRDRETLWQDGADIAARWPRATLHTTTALGHNRILRDSGVVELATRFITDG